MGRAESRPWGSSSGHLFCSVLLLSIWTRGKVCPDICSWTHPTTCTPHPHMRNTPLFPLCEASCTLLSLGLPPPALQLFSQLPPPPRPPPSSPLVGHHPVLPASAQFSSDSSSCLVCHGIPSLLARCLAHSRHFVFLNKYDNFILRDTTLDVD